MGARAGPEAEIHGSGSETGEVVKDPERPSGSKPGREEKAVWEGGSGGLRHPTPPPCGAAGPGSETQVVGAGCPDIWIYGQKCSKPRLFCSQERQESCPQSPRGAVAEDHGSGGLLERGGASTPGLEERGKPKATS